MGATVIKPEKHMSDTPRTNAAAGKPSHDWEKTAERLFFESQKLERELAAARAEAARLNGQTRWQCACGGTDCAGQKAHEQLRKDVQFVIDHAGRTIETEHGDIKCGALWMAEQLGAALDTAQVVKALRTAEERS